eukprot:1385224-Pleurochrysis_carterae.AAC.1
MTRSKSARQSASAHAHAHSTTPSETAQTHAACRCTPIGHSYPEPCHPRRPLVQTLEKELARVEALCAPTSIAVRQASIC